MEAYDDAFPLHDGTLESYNLKKDNRLYKNATLLSDSDIRDKNTKKFSYRHVLRTSWARFGNWYCWQPLDVIKEYYGTKVALYFAWLGYYTSWLVLPAIMGLITTFYGFTQLESPIVSEIKNDDRILCPQSDFSDRVRIFVWPSYKIIR